MDDRVIVDLFWTRSERAIEETAAKYGPYCRSIAYNILGSAEDADEAVNDTYLGAWNSMPPHRPSILSTFLGKITRRVSINRWNEGKAEKRGGGQLPLALDELSDCIPSDADVDRPIREAELARIIDDFVAALPDTERRVFVCRYWYLDSIASICSRFSFTPSKVKSMLSRTREKLRSRLREEDVFDET